MNKPPKIPRNRKPPVYEPYFSYGEIAKEMGITRVAVQQIEQRILKKIAIALIINGYCKEDFL